MTSKNSDHWQQRWLQLIDRLQTFTDAADVEKLLGRVVSPQKAEILTFIDTEAMNEAATSAEFFNALLSADTVLPEGTSIAKLDRMMGRPAGVTVSAADIIPRILARYNGKRIALFGAHQEHARHSARNSMADALAPHSQIDSAHGFHHLDIYVAMALHQKPELIVLGMGMPKQELLAAELRKVLKNTPCLIVCAGATLDLLESGQAADHTHERPAPSRLLREPKRLLAHYIIGLPSFRLRAMRLQKYAQARGAR